MNEFAARLKMLREQHDLPLSKLAEAIGSTKSALSRYENAKMEPGLTVLMKLAEYFGVTIDWLCGNCDIDDIQYADRKNYTNAINKCIKENITPEKLEQLIDVLKR